MARPSKMTPENVERILTALRSGSTRKGAAGYAPIDEVTFDRWMNRYANFASQVKLAEDECKQKLVACWTNAAEHDWRAAQALLERRHPQEWGPQSTPASDAVSQLAQAFSSLTGSQPTVPPVSTNGHVVDQQSV